MSIKSLLFAGEQLVYAGYQSSEFETLGSLRLYYRL